jgi:hypothetical protein
VVCASILLDVSAKVRHGPLKPKRTAGFALIDDKELENMIKKLGKHKAIEVENEARK